MKTGARLRAAEEVLADIAVRHRPAADALSDWGKSHRFAGSSDRSAIGNLVYDALRRRSSISARMQSDAPRALVLGAAATALDLPAADIVAAADGSAHAIDPLSEDEQHALLLHDDVALPAHAKADVPAWLFPSFERVFGDQALAEGQALAVRAPVDLRVNTLKATRARVLSALSKFHPEPTPHSALGVRLQPPRGGARTPNVELETAHGKGWFEVQDEGSQLAALLSGAGARMQVLDLCAGAGGKALAFAASMQNTGQVYAYDRDRGQLRPIFERLKRAGARNVQVMEAGDSAALLALGPRFDTVVIDAPCTGAGTWRRRPDAKWRLSPENLAQRIAEQRDVLATARRLVRPGGRLVYITCSMLAEENSEQIDWFMGQAPEFSLVSFADPWRQHVGESVPASADGRSDTLLLTPKQHQTDGFFIAAMLCSS